MPPRQQSSTGPFRSPSSSPNKERHGSGGTEAELSSAGIRELIRCEAGKQVPVPRERRSICLKPLALRLWHRFTTEGVQARKSGSLEVLLGGT